MTDEIRVLLIEDNPGDARLIREMLVSSPRERIVLDQVSTFDQSLQYLAASTYDAILLDLSLPDSHGLRTLSRIEGLVTNTAIIVLTGLDDEALGIEAVQIGAQDYLSKGSIDSRLLTRSVRYAIERQHAEMILRQSEEAYRSLIDDVFNTSAVAVLILDSSYQVVWCNEITETYFGIRRDRLLQQDKRILIANTLKWTFTDPEDYASRILQSYAESSFAERIECHVLPASGREERWLEYWSQPIRSGMYQGGRIEQYTDITEQKMLEFAERAEREFAEALHEISTVLTGTLDLDEVLNNILANLGRVVPHDSASISIIEVKHFESLRQQSVDNKLDTQEIIAIDAPQLEYAPYADMVRTGQSVLVRDLQINRQSKPGAEDKLFRSYIGTPIQLNNQVIGFINLLSTEQGFFNEIHSRRLSAFAKLAAIAIQNAQMFKQSKQLAALEERQRLARELHDSVSQTLFTCRTMSESALRRWQRDPVRAHELIRDVNLLTATALAEMRILLLELRPAALEEIDLKQLFEQYLQPIQHRREFQLKMALDEIPALPADVKIAFYRITQEALNNIDKHAQATLVEVRTVNDEDRIVLEIRDDGRGFDLQDIPVTSLGLGIIRERAEEIGALLEINSTVNLGTQITVIWEKE